MNALIQLHKQSCQINTLNVHYLKVIRFKNDWINTVGVICDVVLTVPSNAKVAQFELKPLSLRYCTTIRFYVGI
jgi:hypothetical protein